MKPRHFLFSTAGFWFCIGVLIHVVQGQEPRAVDSPSQTQTQAQSQTQTQTQSQTDQPNDADNWKWEVVRPQGKPVARHEASFVAHQNKIYLIGGRRINPVSVYDPEHNTWTDLSPSPLELHHFQAVVWGEGIYLMGAMTGKYPSEKPVEKIVVYYPASETFEFVHSIPPARRRGGAGAVTYEGKIYLVGGITNGHISGTVSWFDQYDPVTGDWKPLPDMPHARDHISVSIANGKLIVAGGRQTNRKDGNPFSNTVAQTDVFNFKSGRWETPDASSNIPTTRAGAMAFSYGDLAIVGGGESMAQKTAHSNVEAFDVNSRTWKQWPKLNHGRHGTGFAIVGDYVYTAAGSLRRGGKPETEILERLPLPNNPLNPPQ